MPVRKYPVLIIAALLAVFTFTGCETLQRIEAENPVLYGLGKGAAEVALLSLVATSDSRFIADNRFAVTTAINAAFARGEAPADVALNLTRELENELPDDPAVREAILRNLIAALQPPAGVPASALSPEARYKAELADALARNSTPASSAVTEIDYSLWGWMTKPETRKATKAYYRVQEITPEQREWALDLQELQMTPAAHRISADNQALLDALDAQK